MESDATEAINKEAKRYKQIHRTISQFSIEMEFAMEQNNNKGDWDALAAKYLLSKLDHHRDMLLLSLEMSRTVMTSAVIKKRCVNIANYAMMLHSQV